MRRQFRILAAILSILMVVAILPFQTQVNAATAKDNMHDANTEYVGSYQYTGGEKCMIIIHYYDEYIEIDCSYEKTSTSPSRMFFINLDPDTYDVINSQCKVYINSHPYIGTIDKDFNPGVTDCKYSYSLPSGYTDAEFREILNQTTITSMANINAEFTQHFDVSLGDLGFKNYAALNKTVPDVTALTSQNSKVTTETIKSWNIVDQNFDISLDSKNYSLRVMVSDNDVTFLVEFDDNTVALLGLPTKNGSEGMVGFMKVDGGKYTNELAISYLPVDYNLDTSNLYLTYIVISTPYYASRQEMNDAGNVKIKLIFQIVEKFLATKQLTFKDWGLTNYYTTPTPTPTKVPTKSPTKTPTKTPTKAPAATAVPTKVPVATSAPKPTTSSGAKPTVKPTAVPSKTPTSSPATPSTPADNGIGGFIDRLYTVALGRDFDEGGKNYWTDEIKFNGKNGADIAYEFLYSEEFLGKNMSQDDFLTILYRTFFDREPDASGLKYWKDQMSAGKTKEWVIAGFINSEEWANICLSFGIRSGSSVAPTITITPNENVIGFATRLYTTCLKREYDPSGLDFWAKEIANLRRTGSEAAKGFFFSDELNKSGISDAEFLTRLYKTLMNREPEKEGFDYWLGQMKSGAMSRSDVFDGFAASKEWAEICADYGILR